MRVDVHQHIWTEGLYAALARRTAPPRLRPRAGGWVLELPGAPPSPLPSEPQDPERRAAVLGDLGVDVAVLALSATLGAEALPGDEARELLAAWDADADALPAALPAWGSLALREPDPADVDDALRRGRVGVTVPAGALACPAALDRLGAVLERLAVRDAPLFVHPGPPPDGAWLPALTSDVGSLAAAWHAWALHGRRAHPELRVVFAALAGLAPLHAERLRTALPRRRPDTALTFYETSSYGPDALDALVRAVGPGALVHGSDWPHAEPARRAPELRRALLRENPAALLRPVSAVIAA